MSIPLLASSAWLGYELTTTIIQNRINYLTRICIGIPLGITLQSFIFFITTIYFPLNSIHGISVTATFCLAAFALFLINKKINITKKITFSFIEIVLVGPIMALVVWSAMVTNIYHNYTTRGPSFADLPFHMNIIMSFAQGINMDRKSLFGAMSIFQRDVPLAYPMLHNFYIAVMISVSDTPIHCALQWTAMLMAFCSIILIHSVFLEFSQNRIIAALSVPIWGLLGGLGWTMRFYHGTEFDPMMNWINHLGEGISTYFMQPLFQIFIPQRSAMFSFPFDLAALLCFMKVSSIKKFTFKEGIRYLILAALCTAFLPQIQIHSFVAIAQYAIASCVLFIPSKKRFWSYFWAWSIYGLISCAIGLPLTTPYWKRRSDGADFLKLKPIWNDKIYGNLWFPLVSIWWKGIGPFAYVAIFMGWVYASKWQLKHWGAAMFVWLLTSIIRYQPWALDNMKLFFAAWLPIVVPFVTQFYVRVFEEAKKKKHLVIQIIVIILILQGSFSTLLSMILEVFHEVVFIDEDDWDTGHWIAENTAYNETFMSYGSRLNPATSIAGRQLYLGFFSWIAQHGVNGPNRLLMQNELLEHKRDYNRWKNENVLYVLTNKGQDLKFPLSKLDQDTWSVIYQKENYTIYHMEKPKEEKSIDKRRNKNKNRKWRNMNINFD